MNTLANIQKVMDIQFEISQKKTYEVKNASKTTEFDAKGIWIYKPLRSETEQTSQFTIYK